MRTHKLDRGLCGVNLILWRLGTVFLINLTPCAQAAGQNGQVDIGVKLQPGKPTDNNNGQAKVAFTRETLRGLEGVWVVVTRRESRAEKYGLTMRTLQSQIETLLGRNNIRVMSQKQYTQSHNAGILCIDILPLISEEMGFSAVSINIALMQNVMLTGDNETRICQATTWERRTVALCDLESIKEIPQNVTGFVNHFIKDFNAVNSSAKAQEPSTGPTPSRPEEPNEPESKNPPRFMMI